MKYKRIIYANLISLLALLIFSLGCANGGNANAESLLKNIPEDVRRFSFQDLIAIRSDDELEDLYDSYKEIFDRLGTLSMVHIDIEDVNSMSMADVAGDPATIILKGNFNLNDVREELDNRSLDKIDYKGVEIWESYESNAVALSGDLIIIGYEGNIKDCINVIKAGEDSMLDDNDIKDVMDRLPRGIAVTCGTDEEYPGMEAWGMSMQKKDYDTLKMIAIFKFKDEDAAEGAIDEVEDDAAEKMDDKNINVDQINVDQDGEFVILTIDMNIDYFLELAL